MLTVCDGCQRHVRGDDPRCPFCGADVTPAAPRPARPRTDARVGRAALFVVGAAIAGAAGCEESSPAPAYGVPPIDAGVDSGGPAPAYGAAPIDTGEDAGLDAGNSAAAYGAPPVDGG